MIPRTLYSEDHEIFRGMVAKFFEKEVVPHHDQWERDGLVPLEFWRKAGQAGILCCDMPEEYGGGGADFKMAAIVNEEQARLNISGPNFAVHSDIVAPYVFHFGSEDQKQTWLPKMASGECVGAIAMTEPGTGSDLQGVKTRAVMDGNQYVINGSKTFISNGQNCGFVIVVAKTDPDKGAHGTSLFIVEDGREGFARGRNLEKIGLHAQDTSELFFEDVRVPPENMLGQEGQGFAQLMQELPRERLLIAIGAVSNAEAGLQWTIDYTRERKAFGKAISEFQNTRFKLAEMKAELALARVFVDKCIDLLNTGDLDVESAAIAKLTCSELQCRVLDECLQLHGGYGYMREYPIARAWADARVQRIYGGTSEIMKELISRTL
ncbi:MAG TPA: acyl-CoA dehydrogenase family protein [Alphaproteobacteria bacterium]|nr:acyl-CoA dehydrogenase family protein [Alphaproteobacteria bacterium]